MNNFSQDPSCKALWLMDDGGLLTDTIGTNTLVDHGGVAQSVDCKVGVKCGSFGSGTWLGRDDADLGIGFPLKASDTVKNISVCFWCKRSSKAEYSVFSKSNYATGAILDIAIANADEKLQILLGYNSGSSYQTIKHGLVMGLATWYHVGVTYEDSTKAYRMRVWDDTASICWDTAGTASNNINVEASNISVGSDGDGGYEFEGLIDEVVIFNDILTVDEIDEIRRGVYGVATVGVQLSTGRPDGTVFGQSGDKISFHGADPVVQASGSAQAACPAGGTGAEAGCFDTAAHRDECIGLITEIRETLLKLGLMRGY